MAVWYVSCVNAKMFWTYVANMSAFEVEEVDWVLTAQSTARHETAEADISE